MRKVGEDVTEVLKYVPGHFEVERHVRPAVSCRKCEAMMQAPMPALPIPRGQADVGLLTHVAIAKYCDHIPLYRQAEIYAREGVELDRSLLADWIGKMAWLLRPLAEKVGEHVMAGKVIHADDTWKCRKCRRTPSATAGSRVRHCRRRPPWQRGR
jgi:transposase